MEKTKELRCSEVRWFYKRKRAVELWKPFNGYNSIRLEVFWRYKNGEHIDSKAMDKIRKEELKSSYYTFVLNGFAYRALEDFSSAYCVFSEDNQIEIRRGTWFDVASMQPLHNKLAELIEKKHLELLRSQASSDTFRSSENAMSSKQALAELRLDDGPKVVWKSLDKITLYKNTIFYPLSCTLRRKGSALKRGYEEARYEDGQNDISHLLLVVHGMGHKDNEGLIAKNSEKIKRAIYAYMDKYSRKTARPMVFLVRWRGKSEIDDKLETLRSLITNLDEELKNSCTRDVIASIIPMMRQEYESDALNRLAEKLIAVFEKLRENNLQSKVRTSVLAHSLGSVLCYQIIAGDIKDCSATCLSYQNDESYRKFRQSVQRLKEEFDFRVSHLFCIGSPLAAILQGRGEKTFDPNYITMERLYNIFYPHDPIAYRLEPAVHRRYRFISPINLLASTDYRSFKDYDSVIPQIDYRYASELEKEEKSKAKRVEEGGRKSCGQMQDKDDQEKGSSIEIMKEIEDAKQLDAETFIEQIPVENRLERRLDFQLPKTTHVISKVTDVLHLETLTWLLRGRIMYKSHSSYWTNEDLAAFIVNQMFRSSEQASGQF